MKPQDVEKFCDVLGAAMSIYDKTPSEEVALFWFEALKQFELADIRAALTRHVKDPVAGEFAPKIASVIRAIGGGVSAWLSADEAWARAALAYDDRNTVVLCAEIRDALASVRHLIDAGDKYNAPRAFRDAYERNVAISRQTRPAPRWEISAGYDAEQRRQVTQQAVDAGVIALADGRASVPLIAGPGERDDLNAEANRARLRDVLAILKKPKATQRRDKSPDVAQADEIKAAQQREVDEYMKADKQ